MRSFLPADQLAVARLYREGLLAGQVDPNDAAADLADIKAACFGRPQDHFWVAEAATQVVGTIAITINDQQVGHLRRLRVAPAWQESGHTTRLLVETATAHAREHACLKLVLHTPLDDKPAVTLLHRLGFEFSRSRDLNGRHLLEFYVNLYMPQKPTHGAEEHGSLAQSRNPDRWRQPLPTVC
ncbi:MAG: GNAT family N-acetyltransferase [Tepidisphaeraceae bacterium]